MKGKYIYDRFVILHLPTLAAENKILIKYPKKKPYKVLHNGNSLYFKNIDDVLEYVNPPAFKAKQIYELFTNL